MSTADENRNPDLVPTLAVGFHLFQELAFLSTCLIPPLSHSHVQSMPSFDHNGNASVLATWPHSLGHSDIFRAPESELGQSEPFYRLLEFRLRNSRFIFPGFWNRGDGNSEDVSMYFPPCEPRS